MSTLALVLLGIVIGVAGFLLLLVLDARGAFDSEDRPHA